MQNLSSSVNVVTGSYIQRLANSGETIELKKKDNKAHIYQVVADGFEPFTIALQPINLYNSNAPFSDRQWALAAAMPDGVLFENSAKIKSGIISSSAISLLLGIIFMLITVRLATKPLLSIALQIEHGNADDPVVVKNSNTYEINLLCDTINEIKRKRQDEEIALREEGERYLLALESAIDIFIEYDILKDRLRIYYFTGEAQKQQLTSQVIEDFCGDSKQNSVCHPFDIRGFVAILRGERTEPYEMRLWAELFPHVADTPSDNGYHWFLFTAIQIRSEDGVLEKTIGSADQITNEKLNEFVAFCAAAEVEGFVKNLRLIYDSIYIGENEEIAIAINLGICVGYNGGGTKEGLNRAFAAAYSCGSTGVGCAVADNGAEPLSGGSYPQSSSYSDIGAISKESIVGFVLSLFEQANDIRSVMNMLLRILGGLFSLDRIIICEYDEDFGVNQVS